MEKQHRLKDNKEFKRVFREKNSTANRQFVIYSAKSMNKEFRVGISISKKIGNAVERNRIKRWIKEAIREKKDQIRTHIDFIIIVRIPASNMDHESLRKSLYHAVRKAKLFTVGRGQI